MVVSRGISRSNLGQNLAQLKTLLRHQDLRRTEVPIRDEPVQFG